MNQSFARRLGIVIMIVPFAFALAPAASNAEEPGADGSVLETDALAADAEIVAPKMGWTTK